MRRLPRLLVPFLLLACTDAEDVALFGRATAPLSPTTRDSAGITIHAHPMDAIEQAPLITIDSVPIAVIGDVDSVDLDLSRVSGPIFLRNGHLALFASGSVWIFDSAGNEVERIGRQGAGPKEFGSGSLAAGTGDTIIVTDNRNSRIALVVPGSGVARVRSAKLRAEEKFYGAGGQIGDDAFLMTNRGSAIRSEAETGRLETPVGRIDPGADSVREIISLWGPRFFVERSGDNGMSVTTEQYAPVDMAAMWGADVLVVRGDRWAVERYDVEGRLQSRIVVPRSRVAISEDMRKVDIEAHIDGFRKTVLTALEAEGMDTVEAWAEVRRQPYADSLAHFRAAYATPGGLAWLQALARHGDSTWHFTAVRPDGRIVGVLKGAGHVPVLLGDDRVVLRREDDDGIVTWAIHRLKMP